MIENPYQSPRAHDFPETQPEVAGDSFTTIARRTFLAWEKLRLVYIAVLVSFTLVLGLLASPKLFTSGYFWVPTIMGAVVANLCFFAGPIVETYVACLGYDTKRLRIILFVLGTLFTCVLVVIVGWMFLSDMMLHDIYIEFN